MSKDNLQMCKIHERLREERERLGLNKLKFSEAGGISNSAYTNYETGARSPDAEFLAAIALAGADVNYILTGIRTPPPIDMGTNQRIHAMCEMLYQLPEQQQREILFAVEEKQQLHKLKDEVEALKKRA